MHIRFLSGNITRQMKAIAYSKDKFYEKPNRNGKSSKLNETKVSSASMKTISSPLDSNWKTSTSVLKIVNENLSTCLQ